MERTGQKLIIVNNKVLVMKFILINIFLLLGVFSLPETTALDECADEMGRQCCTKTVYFSDGTSLSMTACAGWFLSNDANAYVRACNKASEALGVK